jgi:hypothetical protein
MTDPGHPFVNHMLLPYLLPISLQSPFAAQQVTITIASPFDFFWSGLDPGFKHTLCCCPLLATSPECTSVQSP